MKITRVTVAIRVMLLDSDQIAEGDLRGVSLRPVTQAANSDDACHNPAQPLP